MKKQEGLLLVEQKVDDFNKNESIYLSKAFQETETRNRFIDPLFTALGWELEQTNLNRQVWDVHREFSQRDDSSTKKPDYAFRVKDNNKFKEKFFVEAKAPWVSLTDAKPVFQAKRYAFSSHGKAPIVILTDFQEFRVFNGLERPRFENPLQGLIKELDLKYTDYLDKWDIIWTNFSKEAVYDGSIENLAGKVSRNTKTLDDEFLNDIIDWREILARNVANRNKNLTVDEINEAVQRILDRLVFIRNLEDRNIEDENLLMNLVDRQDDEDAHFYKCIIPLFRKFDIDYNGLLFKKHFSEELEIDNKIIKDIIKSMSSEVSPFRFDKIEPEILGRIYERFLGSKIRLTEDHHAKVEMKPEVNHAGGVFYTPEYIVKYIVENTVGEKIKGKTSEEIEQLKILDPACGSGSFLLGAFDYLIKYHQDYYSRLSKTVRKNYKNDFFETPDGEIHLTLQKKARILKNNIFGVDIDREATEVAIMSLYLKLLDEGFDKGQAMLFMKGHILPDMTANVKCGNSLIDREQLFSNDMFGAEDIKPFDWKTEFSDIFNKGGFDCIIGNPPYIKTQELQSFQPQATELYKKLYKSGSQGNFDIYIIFIEKALELLKTDGLVGYICPHKFFNSNYGLNVRELISEKKNINKILHFGINQVFENATTYTCLLFLSGQYKDSFEYFEFKNEVDNIEQEINNGLSFYRVDSNKINSENWIFVNTENEAFLDKIRKNKPILEDITTNIFQGPKAGADPVFIVKLIENGSKKCKCYSSSLSKEFDIEKDIIKPYVKGKNIKRYSIERNNEYIIFPYDNLGKLISEKTLEDMYPLAYSYLSEKENKSILLEREEGRFKKIWWSYSRPQNMQILNKYKILTPFNAFHSSFAYDSEGDFIFSAGVSGAYGILLKEEIKINYFYLLGLLNSSLIDKFLKTISTALRGGFYSYENKYIKQLPIYLPDHQNKEKFALCQKIEEMVKQIIEFKKDEKHLKDAEFLEKKIDEMVEKIYLG